MKLEDLKPGTVLVSLTYADRDRDLDVSCDPFIEHRRVVVRVDIISPRCLPSAQNLNPRPEAIITLRFVDGTREDDYSWWTVRGQWFLEGSPQLAARRVKLVTERVTDTEEEIRELQAKLAYLKGLT